MRNPENAIEKVLAGLRDTEAPLGLESRVMAAVEMRTSIQPIPASRRAWRMALAGAVAASLALAITAMYWHGYRLKQSKESVVAPKSFSSEGPGRNIRSGSVRAREQIMTGRTKAPARKGQQTGVDDAVLLSEMRAPSRPAPEEPLTDEEKLLLRAVRLGDPQVTAMLNPEVRARQEAESEAEFQRFADQSGNGDSERNLNTR